MQQTEEQKQMKAFQDIMQQVDFKIRELNCAVNDINQVIRSTGMLQEKFESILNMTKLLDERLNILEKTVINAISDEVMR